MNIRRENKMKKTIELDDTLQERVDSAHGELVNEVYRYLEQNYYYDSEFLQDSIDEISELTTEDVDSPNRLIGFSSIVDSSVPVYYYEIDTIWFLHKQELIEAYEDAGIGDNPTENNGMTAIYLYIEKQLIDDFEDILEEAKEELINDLNKIEENE